MRIAVSNPDNIGDFVIRQPMLAALAAAGHQLLLIVRTHVAPLATWAVPGATIVQCVGDPYQPRFHLDAAPDDRVIQALTAFDPDILVISSFQHTQLEEQLAQRLPRAKVIGFGGELFQNDKSQNITHVSAIQLTVQVQVGRDWLESRKNELLTCAILGTSVTLPSPRLTPEKGFLTAASERLRRLGLAKRKFWIVCAGEGSAYTKLKNWSLEKWSEVCSVMVRDHGLHLIFVGTPSEHESTAAILAQMGPLAEKTFDMTANPDGLDMLVGLTHYAEGYLGKDTGPMHIAAALGKPVVAVFGGGHWPRFLPAPATGKVLSMQVPCSDCNWTCPYKTSYCVKNIPVDGVLDAIRAVIAGKQKTFEVELLELEPWVTRAMVLDAADTARDAVHALEVERANFHQWHDDRVRDIDALRQDLARVEAEKVALAQQRDELASTVAQLESTTASSAAVTHELRNTGAIRDQEVARLSGQAAALDTDRLTLQRMLTQRDADLVRLTENAIIAATQAEIFRKQCDSITEASARHAAQLAEVQSQLSASHASEATLRQELAARSEVSTHLAASLAENSVLREANQRLDEECTERAAALDAALASLDTVESRYQGTIADLRQQLRRCQDELTSVLLLVPDLRDELARCLAEVARIPAIEQDQAEKQALIDQLTQTLEFVEADRADRLELINSLSAKLAAVEADSANRLEVIRTLSASLTEVESDQRAKQDVIDSLIASLDSANAVLEKHQQLLVEHQENLASVESAVRQHQRHIAEIDADRAARLQLIERLSAELATLEDDRANRGRQIEQLHAHIEHQQAEIDKLEASLLPRRLVNLVKRS